MLGYRALSFEQFFGGFSSFPLPLSYAIFIRPKNPEVPKISFF